jgi:hypothetical protein
VNPHPDMRFSHPETGIWCGFRCVAMNHMNDEHGFGPCWNFINMLEEQVDKRFRELLDVGCADIGVDESGAEGFSDFCPRS